MHVYTIRSIRRITTTVMSSTNSKSNSKAKNTIRKGRVNLQLCFALCGVLTFVFIIAYLMQNDPADSNTYLVEQFSERKSSRENHKPVLSYNSEKYQLNLDHCKIPKVPLDEGNESYDTIKRKWSSSPCQGGISSLDQNGDLILSDAQNKCCYKTIFRPTNVPKDTFAISEDCTPLESTKPNQMKDEYFQVECPSKGPEYHTTIQMTPKIQEKIKYWDFNVPSDSDRPPSVLMLAIDATSRTGLYRNLPKTVRLLDELQFVDFKGHHILGEPTFPNAIPVLFGTSAEEFWKVNKTKWTTPWDDYPFIWKDFEKLNYITQFIEDEQVFGTFQYGGQTGFKHQPTDLYPRPLLLAMQQESMTHRSKKPPNYCFGNKSMPEYLLNYVRSFITKIRGIPSFSLTWLTWPQHEFMEQLPLLDNPLSSFFTDLSKDLKLLDNTFIIFFSDHGSWNSPYSGTPEGLVERRLPFLYIRYPKKLQEKPDGAKQLRNLVNNQLRITTHYDTHKTLLHLAQMAATMMATAKVQNTSISTAATLASTTVKKDRGKGLSLLDQISRDRTCEDADIPTFACACDLSIPTTQKFESEEVKQKDASNNQNLQLPPIGPNAHPFG